MTNTTTTTPALKGIHHLGITVTDIERSEEWYARVLGMKRLFVEPHFGSDEGGYAVVIGGEDPSFNLGLEHHPGNDGAAFDPRRNGLDHVSFTVGQKSYLEAWGRHLDTQGVEHTGIREIESHSIAMITLFDPDGIAIELFSIG